jgi:RNA polymerase sigma factor (sigma-70 family)
MSGTDLSLLQRWHSHADAEAFKEITKRHAAMVYAVCCRLLGNATEADDVAQDCFETLARNKKLPKGSLGAWLHRMATNRALDRIKTEGRRKAREQRYSDERAAETAAAPEWEDIYQFVDEAIAELRDEFRAPVVAHFLEDRTHAEIAEDLGVSRQTVTYRTGKGIEAIRKALRERGVQVTATALTAMFAGSLAEAAPVPVSLSAALGKVALSGVKGAAGGSAISLSGALVLKAVVGMGVIAAMGLGLWHYAGRDVVPPDAPAPAVVATSQETGADTPLPKPPNVTPPSAAAVATEPNPVAAPEDEGCVISGRVYDKTTGKGLPEVEVIALPDDGTASFSYVPGKYPKTNAQGEYRIFGLDPGPYKVRSSGTFPFSSGAGRRRYTLRLQAPSSPKTQRVETKKDHPVSGIDFPLHLGVSIEGHVTYTGDMPQKRKRDKVARYLDEKGITVEGRSPGLHQFAVCAEDGGFIMGAFVPQKELFLRASADGLVSAPSGPHTIATEDISGVELVLFSEGRITGQLLDSHGAPLAKTPIMALSNLPNHLLSELSHTDAQGEFLLESLHEGHYDLCVNASAETKPGWRFDNAIVLKSVEVRWGQSINGVVLRAAAHQPSPVPRTLTIQGHVTDARGRSIPGVHIRTMDPEDGARRITAETDALGKYTLKDLSPGTHKLTAQHPDFSQNDATRKKTEAGEVVDFVLEKQGRVTGRAIDAETGRPIEAFQLAWAGSHWQGIDPNTQTYRHVRDEDGRFTIEAADAGPVTVVVRAAGYLDLKEPVQVEPETETGGVVIALGKGESLEGIVLEEAGTPVEGASIFFNRVPGKREWWDEVLARTDSTGKFSLKNVPGTTKSIVAAHGDYAPGWGSFKPGQRDIEIILAEGGTLRGLVSKASEPLADARIAMVLRETRGRIQGLVARTDTRGAFEIEGAAPGEYIVTCYMEKSADPLKPARSLQQHAEIQSGMTTEIAFDFPLAAAAIEGMVFNQGQPAAKIFVRARVQGAAGDEHGFASTNEDGHFLMENLPEGEAVLMTSVSRGGALETGSVTQRHALQLRNGETARHDFDFSGGGTIVGRVHAQREEGENVNLMILPGAQEMAWPEESGLEAVALAMEASAGGAVIQENGAFRIEGLEAGTYTVLTRKFTVNEDGLQILASASQVVEITESGEATVELDLR